MSHRVFLWTIVVLWPLLSVAQQPMQVIKEHKQQKFPRDIPAGHYSGITYLGDDRYAVVSDKSAEDGFFVFHIELDKESGKILQVHNEGFRSSGKSNRDLEGIAYNPFTRTLYICGEAGNQILEYTLEGQHTGRSLRVPDVYKQSRTNLGFEALAFDPQQRLFWAVNEGTLKCDGEQASAVHPVRNRLRLQSFDTDTNPQRQLLYEMDEPQASKAGRFYAMGVSALCALDNGQLLVLEREAYVSMSKIGSWVHCKLYVVSTLQASEGELLQKTLLTEFRTRLNLLRQNFADYEGMCLGPELADGSRVLLLICDSQNQYGGMLRDWLKVITIKM